MTTYAIDDGQGNRLTAGLAEHEAARVAQRMADDRGESVYLYAPPDGEYVEAQPLEAMICPTV